MSLRQQTGLFGSNDGVFDRENITETTIRSFYHNCIPQTAKQFAKGVFDPIRNMVQWLFWDEDTSHPFGLNFYNRILNLDVTLQAFYPWTIDNDSGRSLIGAVRRTDVNVINTPGIETQKGSDTFTSYVEYIYSTSLLPLSGGEQGLSLIHI